MKRTKRTSTTRPGRLSFVLAITAMALLLNACTTRQAEYGTAGQLPLMLANGLDKQTSERFWSRVKPVSTLAQSHYKLGRYYQRSGKHTQAIEEFSKAIRLNEQYVPAYNALGVSYDALGDCVTAEQFYVQAIRYNADLAYLHNNLGCSRLLCNDPGQARVHLTRAVELDATTPRIHNNLLLAEMRLRHQTPPAQGLAQTLASPPAAALHRSPAQAQPGRPAPATASATPTATETSTPTAPPSATATTAAIPPQVAAAGAPEATLSPSPPRETATSPFPAAVPEGQAMPQTISQTNEPKVVPQPGKSVITVSPLVPMERQAEAEIIDAQTAARLFACAIEVSNGNGVTGMAKRSAGYLRELGFTVGRITNASHFSHGNSTIYYQDGFQELAGLFARVIPGAQEIKADTIPNRPGIGIRLLLGKDIAAINFPESLARTEEGPGPPLLEGGLVSYVK